MYMIASGDGEPLEICLESETPEQASYFKKFLFAAIRCMGSEVVETKFAHGRLKYLDQNTTHERDKAQIKVSHSFILCIIY
jgi:hypothetical protein